jgi:hypothetical protein
VDILIQSRNRYKLQSLDAEAEGYKERKRKENKILDTRYKGKVERLRIDTQVISQIASQMAFAF